MQNCILFSACKPDGRLLRSILEKSFQGQAYTHDLLSTNHDSQSPTEGACREEGGRCRGLRRDGDASPAASRC